MSPEAQWRPALQATIFSWFPTIDVVCHSPAPVSLSHTFAATISNASSLNQKTQTTRTHRIRPASLSYKKMDLLGLVCLDTHPYPAIRLSVLADTPHVEFWWIPGDFLGSWPTLFGMDSNHLPVLLLFSWTKPISTPASANQLQSISSKVQRFKVLLPSGTTGATSAWWTWAQIPWTIPLLGQPNHIIHLYNCSEVESRG